MGIIGILGGLIAMGPYIISKRPDAKEMLDKLAPYTGYIGVVLFIWGIVDLIRAVLGIGLLSVVPVAWIIWLLVAVCEAGVGFILGFGLITKYGAGNDPAKLEKAQQALAKIAPYQMIMGAVLLILAVLSFVF